MFTELNVVPILKVKKLHPDAIIPKYHTPGAACFDLHGISDDGIMEDELPPNSSGTIRTGLAFEVPEGYALMIYSRSGHGFKHGVRLANCVGVIDSDYRGEVMVRFNNDGPRPFPVSHGDRIAQAMLIPVQQWHLQEVEALSDTERGAGGFGSTGK